MHRKEIKDFYFYKAKREHYLARSVYKLKEIDEKYHLLKKNDVVLDLGCHPGSWLQYCSKIIGPKGMILGIDVKELGYKPGDNVRFLKADILNLNIRTIKSMVNKHFDVVLSDMAPFTTGVKSIDHQRSMNLARRSLEIANQVLRKAGNFLCKMLEGEESPAFLKEIKERFGFIKVYKPKGSRKESREIYVIGLGKR
ncbi:MAG TPA: RlmE family RNA methyltransferase [Syntrophaceae bacterium]|nr:RlmE family RNA methyltransferase [Syntrophaceae bacterium]